MKKGISIYIVEDDKLARTTYRHLFEQAEDEIEVFGTFETAEECIENMKTKRADVILMDIGLPYMNGIEATKIIKRKYPNTKVIMLTSHDRTDEIFASISSGANAYALKDTDFPALLAAVKTAADSALWVDPRIAGTVLSIIPKPESTDLDKLYVKKKPKKTLNIKVSEQDIEILKLIQKGKTNREIGEVLHISEHTVKAHVSKLLRKLSVTVRVEAAVKALEYNLF